MVSTWEGASHSPDELRTGEDKGAGHEKDHGDEEPGDAQLPPSVEGDQVVACSPATEDVGDDGDGEEGDGGGEDLVPVIWEDGGWVG